MPHHSFKNARPETRLAHLGRPESPSGRAVNTSVSRASTIVFDTYGDLREAVKAPSKIGTPYYGRYGTETQWDLMAVIRDMEGAEGTLLFPSGVAALTQTILAFVKPGDQVLMPDSAYEPMRGFANKVLKRMQVSVSYYPPTLDGGIASYLSETTSVVLVESPGSLTFEVQDIPAISAAAHAVGATVIADNTWATPLYCKPLALGADVSVSAATKYIVGHSDVMMGVASASGEAWATLERQSFAFGQTSSADDAALALRGLRTLDVRLERHQASALEIARRLLEHPAVDRVIHPAFEDCAGHDMWKRDFRGSTGLFSLILKGGTLEDVGQFVDKLAFFGLGFSWGGYESLALPADPTSIRTATGWSAAGPLVRLHIGLENVEDLWADLSAGLERYQAHLDQKPV